MWRPLMDGRMDGVMVGLLYWWMNRCIVGRMDGCINGMGMRVMHG